MSYEPIKQFNRSKYIESSDEFSPTRSTYRFRSPTAFVSIVDDLNKTGKRFSSQDSSETNEYSFSGSKSIEHAVELFREEKFDEKFAKQASLLVNQIRQRTKVSDEGEEISIPEFLSKSDYFIQYQPKNYKRRIIMDIPLIIDCTYPAHCEQEEMLDAGKKILTALYTLKVRCPKIVFAFISDGFSLMDKEPKHSIFVECNFTDFNAFSKMVLPSTFRRLWFRVAEMHQGLPYGYGHCWNDKTGKIEEGISLLEFRGKSTEEVQKSIEEKFKDYARRSSMAKAKNVQI